LGSFDVSRSQSLNQITIYTSNDTQTVRVDPTRKQKEKFSLKKLKVEKLAIWQCRKTQNL